MLSCERSGNKSLLSLYHNRVAYIHSDFVKVALGGKKKVGEPCIRQFIHMMVLGLVGKLLGSVLTHDAAKLHLPLLSTSSTAVFMRILVHITGVLFYLFSFWPIHPSS